MVTFTATAPPDLWAHRTRMLAITGLAGAALGIVGDPVTHRSGYHRSLHDLYELGVFHLPPGMAGTNDDFSARLIRDRAVWGTAKADWASAVDYGDEWQPGGRPAWLRFNALFVAAFLARDSSLTAVRAINYSPDGTVAHRYRIDREHGFAREDSSDDTEIHTHAEWYRDTAGTPGRAASLARIEQLAQAAISMEGSDMTTLDGAQAAQLANAEAMLGAMRDLTNPVLNPLDPAYPGSREFPSAFAATLKRIDANTAKPPVAVDPVAFADALSDSQLKVIGQAMGETMAARVEALMNRIGGSPTAG